METLQSRLLLIDDILVDPGIVDTITTNELKLFTDPSANSPTLLSPSDFTEPTFTGYAPFVLATTPWLGGIDPTGHAIWKYNGLGTFAVGTTSPADIVFGWFITDTGGTNLLAYGFFDSPISMENAGDQIAMVPYLYGFVWSDAEAEFIAGP